MRAVRAPLAVLALLAAAGALASELALEVKLDPASGRLAASAELPRPAGPFRFILHESLHVNSAGAAGTALPVRSEPSGAAARAWVVDLPAAAVLRLSYEGRLPPLDHAIDHRSVLQALPPMASPEGSYLGAATGWYPSPGGLFAYRVSLHIEGGQKALVAGTLEAEDSAPAAYRARFRFPAPTDGIDLMAGPYEVRERSVMVGDRPIRLRTYFFAALAPLAEGYLEDSARYVERYSREVGPYPFGEFSVVASPLPTGFGMPTLTYIGAAVLKLPFIRGTSLGHEVLHNWWGNGVLVDYTRGNWAEGLTTFMADYAFKEGESDHAARDLRLGWLRDLAAVPADSQLALADFRSRFHGAAAVAGYAKSAMLFFMLRDLVGERDFQRGIRSFWERQRFRVASWDDLRAAFEGASGRPLGPFFEQWLSRRGAPSVRIDGARAQGAAVILSVSQAAPPYRLRLPVELALEGRYETHWIEIDQERQQVPVPSPSTPYAVRLDPELRVWRQLDASELPPILRQWIVAPSAELLTASNAPGVREAARALAARLFESPYQEVAAYKPGASPVLLVGLHGDVDEALARLKLPPRPANLEGKGTAQVWTLRHGGAALAVVSARDAAALLALQRPLPHYGAQSFLAFEGARAIERGAWPPAARSVPVAR